MKFRKLIRTLGPGLLYTGAAVGVSHLVQSTRAGAGFGYSLVWAVLVANLMKYPFFEFAPRYTAATGNNLIQGYAKMGRWAVWMYFIISLSTMFIIMAAVTIVSAALLAFVFGWTISPVLISALLLISTFIILLIGRYKLLDKMIKYVIVILAISTLVALILAPSNPHLAEASWGVFDFHNAIHIGFLIALFGWMPAPLDITVWQSMWGEAKQASQKEKISKKEALLDFNIGYIGTLLLALGFLSLGASVMYGSGEELSPKGAVFAGQLINLYTSSIGSWAFPLIATAAIATMLSTTLTCFDAYARVLPPTTSILFPKLSSKIRSNMQRNIWMVILIIGTLIILQFLAKDMGTMIDFATVLSFLVAPLFAILNFKLVFHKHVPKSHQPKIGLKIWAILGIVSLISFSAYYILYKYF